MIKALLIQLWKKYSDREMEKAIKENFAVRWFCGFSISEATAGHTYFFKLIKRIGTKIITKTALWEERDQAIKKDADKLNNSNVKDYAADKDARWGAKSKKPFVVWLQKKYHG